MPYSTKQAVSTASCGGKAGLSGGGRGRRGELGEWPEWCSPTHNISEAESFWEVG